jgi:hypothetical protein
MGNNDRAILRKKLAELFDEQGYFNNQLISFAWRL